MVVRTKLVKKNQKEVAFKYMVSFVTPIAIGLITEYGGQRL
jgi:hypothetical protein